MILVNGGPIFGGATPATTGLNFGIGAGFFYNFLTPYDSFQIHFGAKAVALSILDGSLQRTIMHVLPVFRFEMQRFYVGIGLTPFVSTNTGGGFLALGYMRPVSGVLSYYGEFGLLWRTTDSFHFSLEANAHFTSVSGGFSPGPELVFLFNMRFNFPYSREGKEGGAIRKDGWRYPFGIRI